MLQSRRHAHDVFCTRSIQAIDIPRISPGTYLSPVDSLTLLDFKIGQHLPLFDRTPHAEFGLLPFDGINDLVDQDMYRTGRRRMLKRTAIIGVVNRVLTTVGIVRRSKKRLDVAGMNRESVVHEISEYIRPARQPDVYGPLRRTLPIGDLKRKLIMRRPMTRITETLLDAGAGSVLDVGCGTGVLARILYDRGFQVAGIDSSRTMIRRARTVAPKIELQWLDTTLMTHERMYDAAVVSLALHEMSPEARIRTWDNTMQAVRIGGLVLALDFVEPTRDSIYTRVIRAQIERAERAFDRVNPDHYTNYRQFMAAGGLREWLRAQSASIDSEAYFLGTNLGLFNVPV